MLQPIDRVLIVFIFVHYIHSELDEIKTSFHFIDRTNIITTSYGRKGTQYCSNNKAKQDTLRAIHSNQLFPKKNCNFSPF